MNEGRRMNQMSLCSELERINGRLAIQTTHYRVKGGPKCGFWGFYSVFYSFLTRKCPKNHFEIFDIFLSQTPWTDRRTDTPSYRDARTHLKITPWKTILDDLRGVQGVWDQKTSKISKWCFGHLKYWARINSIGSVRTTRPLIRGHWVQHHVYW